MRTKIKISELFCRLLLGWCEGKSLKLSSKSTGGLRSVIKTVSHSLVEVHCAAFCTEKAKKRETARTSIYHHEKISASLFESRKTLFSLHFHTFYPQNNGSTRKNWAWRDFDYFSAGTDHGITVKLTFQSPVDFNLRSLTLAINWDRQRS